MLHGMIPAAFFATLLRRYLDSLVETQEYVVNTTSNFTCLGTSAAVATAGMVIYGFARLSKKTLPSETSAKPETIQPIPMPQKSEPLPVKKRRRSSSGIRKRNRRGKQWFLKNMRHYRSKYGRRIGKLMNQLLGIPFTESPVEPVDSDDSIDENYTEMPTNAMYNDTRGGNEYQEADEKHFADNAFPCEISSKISTQNEDDSIMMSNDDFDDDDMEVAEISSKRSSSSLDLKDLLRENFEGQKMRRSSRRSSSASGHTRKSSKSHKSSNSQKSGSSYKSTNHNRSNGHKSSRRNSVSDKHYRYKRRNDWTRGGHRSSTKGRPITKKTRSGRCYDNLIP